MHQADLDRRRDVRTWRIVSIDPTTARDLDDALSIRTLANGHFEVGIHIADVSHFVKEGSALDTVARARATTVYMIQRAVPMLPRLLCEVRACPLARCCRPAETGTRAQPSARAEPDHDR